MNAPLVNTARPRVAWMNGLPAGISGETAGLATSVDAFHRDHRLTFLGDASASRSLGEFGAGEVHRVVTEVIDRFGEAMTTERVDRGDVAAGEGMRE